MFKVAGTRIVALAGISLAAACGQQGGPAPSETTGSHAQALYGDCAPTIDTVVPGSPSLMGTDVDITASANCNSDAGTPELQFWAFQPSGTWEVICPWQTATTCKWLTTGEQDGNYKLQVWARMPPNTDPDGTSAYADYTLQPNYCTSATLSGTPKSPAAQGSVVHLTGGATCPGGTTPQYRYYGLNPSTSQWQILCDYADNNTNCDWTPPNPGEWLLQVWVRRKGSTGMDSSSSYLLYNITEAGGMCGNTSINGAPGPGSVSANTPIVLTASQVEYKFWVYNPTIGSWTTPCGDYGSSTTCNWTPTVAAADPYLVQVHVRGLGNTNTYSSSGYLQYQITY